MATFDLQQTDRLLTTTRAVRKRLDLERPVAREIVLDALRVAIQAPTGGTRNVGGGSLSTTRSFGEVSPRCIAGARSRT